MTSREFYVHAYCRQKFESNLKPSLYTHVHILWALKVQSEIKNSQVLN